MHPRAMVGMPYANPSTGLPRLRRSWRHAPGPARSKQTMCVENQGQGWSLVVKVDGVPTKVYKVTVSDQKQAYGQMWWYVTLSPRPELPNGFKGWLSRCGAGPML